MKILFVANRGEIGGAHIALENMIIKLKKEKFDITLITPNRKSKWFDFCQKERIKCEYVNYYEIGYAFNISIIRRVIKFIMLPLYYILNKLNYISANKIRKKIDIYSFDYIHTNTNRDDFGIVLSNMYGIKHIMHLREFDKEFFKIIYLRKNVYQYFCNNTTFFISVSNAIKKNYEKKGITSNKIFTIYDGINYKTIAPKTKYMFDKTFKIVMVGNICKEKGQKKLIDAISIIKCNKNIDVDFYGTGSIEYINKLERRIKKLDLTDRIVFKGYEKNIKDILNKYDLAVMCSKIDGFGLVTIEYMMAGVPVLVSKTGANFEIVSDYSNGFMFNFDDVNSLSKKIEYIIKNYDKAIEVSKKAYEQAIKKYSLDSSFNSIKSLYEGEMINNENKN